MSIEQQFRLEKSQMELQITQLKYELSILINEKKDRLNGNDKIIDQEQEILHLKSQNQQLLDLLDDKKYKIEQLQEEIEYEKQKINNQSIFINYSSNVHPNYKEMLESHSKIIQKQLQLSLKKQDELAEIVLEQQKKLILLEVENKDLINQLKLQGQNQYYISEQQTNNIEIIGLQKENQQCKIKIQELEEKVNEQNKIIKSLNIELQKLPQKSPNMDKKPSQQLVNSQFTNQNGSISQNSINNFQAKKK